MSCKKILIVIFASVFIFLTAGIHVTMIQAQVIPPVIDSDDHNNYTIVSDFSVHVTETGDLDASVPITIHDASGSIRVDHGGKIEGSTSAIESTLNLTSPSNRVQVHNYGTIAGGIDNSASTTGTFSYYNYSGGELKGSYTGGDGADNLYFFEGSTITGPSDIGLGAGNNYILLGKDVCVRDLTSASIGSDATTFVLYGNSAGNPQIQRDFDSGNYTMTNILRLSPGDAKSTVYVGGTISFAGNLETTILKVAGTAGTANDLFISDIKATGGTLFLDEIRVNPQEGTGTLKVGDQFQIANYGLSVSGTPTVTTTTQSEMLTFEYIGGSTDIKVAARENFANHANGNLTRQLAQNIDTMIDAGTMPTQIDRVFGELQFSKKADVAAFFRENDPSANLAFAGAGFRTTQFITQGLTDRMELLRGRHTKKLNPRYNIRLQSECDPIGTGGNHRDRDIFVRAFGAYHKEEATSDLLGYDATTSGLQVGYDWRVANRTYFGLSAAFANIDIDINNTNNSGSDFMLRFGGYYTRAFSNGAFFDAELSYGNHDNEYNRHYNSGLGWRDVHSQFTSHDLSLYMGIGKKISYQSGFYYKPFAAMQYIYYHQPSYAEQGSYGLYQFASKDMSSLMTRFGLKFGRDQFQFNHYLGYELEAGYNLELADNARITGGWAGGQNDLFTLSRGKGHESGFYGSAKLHVRPVDQIELFTRYLAEGSKGGFLHGLECGGQWRF